MKPKRKAVKGVYYPEPMDMDSQFYDKYRPTVDAGYDGEPTAKSKKTHLDLHKL